MYLDSRPTLEAKISFYLIPGKPRKTALSSFACSAARSNNCLRCWLRSWAAAGAGAVGARCAEGGDAVMARRWAWLKIFIRGASDDSALWTRKAAARNAAAMRETTGGVLCACRVAFVAVA